MNIEQLHEKYTAPICKAANSIIDVQKTFNLVYAIQNIFTENEIRELLDKHDNADNDENKYENIINALTHISHIKRPDGFLNVPKKLIKSVIILGLINDNDGILRRNYMTNAKYIIMTVSSDDINQYKEAFDYYNDFYINLIMNASIKNNYHDLINALPNDSKYYRNKYFILTEGYINDDESNDDKTVKKVNTASLFKKWLYPAYKNDYSLYLSEYGLMNIAPIAIAASELNLRDKGFNKRKIFDETFKAYNAYNDADKNEVFRTASRILINMKTSNSYNKFDSETILTALNYTDEFAEEVGSIDNTSYKSQLITEFNRMLVKCHKDDKNPIVNIAKMLVSWSGAQGIITGAACQVPDSRLKALVEMLRNVNDIDDDITDAYSEVNNRRNVNYNNYITHNVLSPLSLAHHHGYSITHNMKSYKSIFKNNETALRFHIMNALNNYIIRILNEKVIGVADRTRGFNNMLTDIVSKGIIRNYYLIKIDYPYYDHDYAIIKLPEFIRTIVNILLTDKTYVKHLHDTHGLSAYDDFNALYNDPRVMSINDYDADKCYNIDCHQPVLTYAYDLYRNLPPNLSVITADDCK